MSQEVSSYPLESRVYRSGGNSAERVGILLLKQMLSSGRGRYAEIFYSPTHTLEGIRRLHKGSLFELEVVRTHGGYGLMLFPEGHGFDTHRLPEDGQKMVTPNHFSANALTISSVFADRSLSRWENFCVYEESTGYALSFAKTDFLKILKPVFLSFSTQIAPDPYRAKVDSVAPLSAAPSLGREKRCFLGVSLENENFDRKERLEATINWIAEHFDECMVVVGDSIHRLTRQIKNPALSEEVALRQSIELGLDFIREKKLLFDSYQSYCRFTFLPMSNPENESEFQQRIQMMKKFASESRPYQQQVERFATSFLQRQAPTTGQLGESDLEKASRYLIEETAFCGYLADQGWSVLVYPGPLDPFKAVSEGKIPDAPDSLRKLRIVSLKLKKLWSEAAKGAASV